MSADEEFGRAVGDALRRETADVRAEPGLAAEVRARGSRRAWKLRTAIGAPLTAAAAAAVLVATAGGTPEPRFANVAQVQEQTLRALRSAQNQIIHERTDYDSGYSETWTDRSTRRYRLDNYSTLVQPDGTDTDTRTPRTGPMHRTQSIAGTGAPGDVRYTVVDWELRTWSTNHDDSIVLEGEVPDILDPDALRTAIDEGRMEMIGPERVGDRDTHHLRLFATRRGYQIDLWVDAATYLPVRETSIVLGEDAPAKPVMTNDYTWLPRSAENLAKLDLVAPPDFTRR